MNDMNLVKSCLEDGGVNLYGMCEFKSVKKYIINCAAKKRLPEKSKTIISCVFPYRVRLDVTNNISKYAVVVDYHKVVHNILNKIISRLSKNFSENKFTAFVDNSPIPEVMTAALCGLGVIGDNGLLINSEYGSWVFIGEIVTDLYIPCDSFPIQECIHCGKCFGICPNDAITNKKVCLSAISQKKGSLLLDEEKLIKSTKTIWGCDICQDNCPMNKNKKFTYISQFYENVIPIIKIGDYERLDSRAFQWRDKSVIERNIAICNKE